MKLASVLGIRGARDKPRDSYGSTAYSFLGYNTKVGHTPAPFPSPHTGTNAPAETPQPPPESAHRNRPPGECLCADHTGRRGTGAGAVPAAAGQGGG